MQRNHNKNHQTCLYEFKTNDVGGGGGGGSGGGSGLFVVDLTLMAIKIF